MLPGITWQGALLAAAAQFLLILAAVRAMRGKPSQVRVTFVRVLLADLLLFPVLLAINLVGRHFCEGPIRERLFVTFVKDVAACSAAWLVWSAALSLSPLRRAGAFRVVLYSLGLALLTFAGLALPGLRPPGSERPAAVSHVVVRLPRLPRELDGLRIVFLSDTHVSRDLSPEALRKVLAPLRGEQADLVVFGGDLVSAYSVRDEPERVAQTAAVLDELCPHVPRLAVLGNHDVDSRPELVTEELEGRGFRVLDDTSQPVRVRGQALWVAGADFSYQRGEQLPRALARVPAGAFTVLVAHTPDILHESQAGRVDLLLSGHTHGGQVVLPGLGPIDANSRYGDRYVSGLYRIRTTRLYVTRGLGAITPGWRLLCDPEITLLELRAGK